jgi:hypothetical protein
LLNFSRRVVVKAEATYYSEKITVPDKAGRVQLCSVLLSISDNNGHSGRKISIEERGGQTGDEPLPVELIIVTKYRPEATWQLHKLTPSQALLALMDSTPTARRNPAGCHRHNHHQKQAWRGGEVTSRLLDFNPLN